MLPDALPQPTIGTKPALMSRVCSSRDFPIYKPEASFEQEIVLWQLGSRPHHLEGGAGLQEGRRVQVTNRTASLLVNWVRSGEALDGCDQGQPTTIISFKRYERCRSSPDSSLCRQPPFRQSPHCSIAVSSASMSRCGSCAGAHAVLRCASGRVCAPDQNPTPQASRAVVQRLLLPPPQCR